MSTAAEEVLAHPSVRRVVDQLAAHRVPGQVVVLDGAARTAGAAAAFLGVDVAQIANSLVFAARTSATAAPEPLLVLASGAHRVDTAKVANLLELADVTRADPDFVRQRTGFAIGGVAPVGHVQRLRTAVDVSLARYDVVWAAAGHPHAVFPTTYPELLRISAGHPVEVV